MFVTALLLSKYSYLEIAEVKKSNDGFKLCSVSWEILPLPANFLYVYLKQPWATKMHFSFRLRASIARKSSSFPLFFSSLLEKEGEYALKKKRAGDILIQAGDKNIKS